MLIRILSPPGTSPKATGDLLESLAEKILRNQGYKLERQVRVTAAEVDLLCVHPVRNTRLYVECKAHRKPLSSSHLHQILGKAALHDYSEVWLFSAGPLGKDAKGFKQQWESKQEERRTKLSIYTPSRIRELIVQSGIVKAPESLFSAARERLEQFNAPILLVAEEGLFWIAQSPFGHEAGKYLTLIYDGISGDLVFHDYLDDRISNPAREMDQRLAYSLQKGKVRKQQGKKATQARHKASKRSSSACPTALLSAIGEKETLDVLTTKVLSLGHPHFDGRMYGLLMQLVDGAIADEEQKEELYAPLREFYRANCASWLLEDRIAYLDALSRLLQVWDPAWIFDDRLCPIGDGVRIAVTPTTVGEYREFAEEPNVWANEDWWSHTGRRPHCVSELSSWKRMLLRPSHPVVRVTWDEAVAFCQWRTSVLSESSSEFRLPTEDEWVRAANAAREGRYPWGEEEPGCGALARANWELAAIGDTTPAGAFAMDFRFPADLAGNVWEWCATGFDSHRKVARGGSWNDVKGLALEERWGWQPKERSPFLGFRTVFSARA